MQHELPTVKISDGDGGFITINESDFDEKIHQRFEEDSTRSLESKTKSEMVKPAKAKSIDTKDIPKVGG